MLLTCIQTLNYHKKNIRGLKMSIKKIIGAIVGAAAGFGLGYFSRCIGAKGWSITSNPWSGMIIGAVIGYLLFPN